MISVDDKISPNKTILTRRVLSEKCLFSVKKIVITKSSGFNYWYKKDIGNVFYVKSFIGDSYRNYSKNETMNDDFVVCANKEGKVSEEVRYILKTDCRITSL